MSANQASMANDIDVMSPPEDTVQALCFAPNANYLVSGSWDNQVRCWEVQQQGGTVPKSSITHDAAVLSVCWSGDGHRVFSASCDKTVKMWTLATNASQVCAQHDAAVSGVAWIDEMQILVSGSWDRTLRYWDLRQAIPQVMCSQQPERVYCMDVRGPMAVVGTADRTLCVYDMRKPDTPYKTKSSPLRYQSRAIRCFYDSGGFAVGSIEGRVAIESFDPNQEKTFTFRCHRSTTEIFPINGIAFHPFNTFATVGGDGQYVFWDKEHKQRIKPYSAGSLPITTCCFNHDGMIFAYATGYDWAKGSQFFNPAAQKPRIKLHAVREDDVKPRSGAKAKKKFS